MKAIMGNISIQILVIKAFFKISLREAFIYRADSFIKFIGYPIRLLMAFFFWKTLFNHGFIKGYHFEDIFTYYLVMYILVQIYPFVRMSRNISNDIINGDIVIYVSKNFSHIGMYIAKFMASSLSYLCIILPVIIILIFINNPSTISIFGFIQFISLLIPGLIIKGQLWYMIGISSFFTEDNMGTIRLYSFLEELLAGSILPLFLFPEWINLISIYLPFRYTIYIPVMSLITPHHWSDFLINLVLSWGWVGLLGISIRLIFQQGWKKFTAHGI